MTATSTTRPAGDPTIVLAGPDPVLARRRQAIVDEHITAESGHDIERALATFHRPHYRVLPLGGETDGAEAVAGLLGVLFTAFPDFRARPVHTYHAAEAVIVECRLTGTHRGPWAGVEATGRPIDVMSTLVFHFDEDRLMSESVYFDQATLLAQLS